MKLRLSNHLIVFGLICLAPAVIAGIVVGYRLATAERVRLERQTVSLVEDYQRDIDADIRSLVGTLEALATARTLDAQDWAAFREQAGVVAEKAGALILLRDLEGRHLVNTTFAGAAPPPTVTTDPVVLRADRQAIDTGQPVLSDLFRGTRSGRPYVAVIVPVIRQGKTVYLLSVAITNERITESLRLGQLSSSGWLAAVVGSDRRVIARTRDIDTFVGNAAAGNLVEAMKTETSGTLTSRTLDGIDVFTAFQRTRMGWTVIVNAPLDELHRPLRTLVLVLVSIVGIVLLVTLIAAWTYGSMLGREVSTLLRNARAMGQDAPLQPYGQHIEEVAEVQQALFDAQAKVEQLIAELNHRVKNTLTVIKVLASRSVGNRRDRDAVVARISALTIAHEALTETLWRGADLGKLARSIARTVDVAVVASGPAVRLTPKAAVAVAQVLQELLSNACQHGALRERSGRVDLVWSAEDDQLSVVWTERAPLKPQAPDHAAGFGLKVIELCVVRQLGGQLSIDTSPQGWSVSFTFPMDGELGQMAQLEAAPSPPHDAGQLSRQA
jgi:two-component sensor histidine kinase